MAIDTRSFSRAEVCPNAGLTHRNLPKYEKNSPSPAKKGSGEGLFFLFLSFFSVFHSLEIQFLPTETFMFISFSAHRKMLENFPFPL
ncbi:hypothetical protein EMIT079MI2_230063 [Bacillus sp. IT-79MI2]|nr:hypothetical protein BTH41_01372 [Bacillus mycoides]